MAREYTMEECRTIFLQQVRGIVTYWANLPDRTALERCEGMAHSMLVLLDGESSLPGFKVIPNPHPDDRDYHWYRGENWWPEGQGDIAGSLHELLFRIK